MLLDILRRIQANPAEFLGARSLSRLIAFETGYLLASPSRMRDYPIENALRDRVVAKYNPSFDVSAMGAHQILMKMTPDEAQTFDLFFSNLDSVLAQHEDLLQKPAEIDRRSGEPPVPVSGFLDVLDAYPNMFLPGLTPGHLYAFLNGVRYACVDAGYPEAADLDGFENWIGSRLKLSNARSWEDALASRLIGRDAFRWLLNELRAYRQTKGPLSKRKYEVRRVAR